MGEYPKPRGLKVKNIIIFFAVLAIVGGFLRGLAKEIVRSGYGPIVLLIFLVGWAAYGVISAVEKSREKKRANPLSQKELEWIAAYMKRGLEKHNVTPHPDVMRFVKYPGQDTLDCALQAQPKIAAIVDKARELLERARNSSETLPFESSPSQEGVGVDGEQRRAGTEPLTKPPETAVEASGNIGEKEISPGNNVAAVLITFIGILLGVMIISALVTTIINSDTANQTTSYTWDESTSDSNRVEPHYNSAVEYEKKVQSPNSDKDYYTARDPQNELDHPRRGDDFFKTGKYAEAIDAYNRALRINPSNVYVYYHRSVAYARTGQYEKAITDCNKVLEYVPNMANAYYNRGFSYWHLGDKQKSSKDFIMAARFGSKEAQEYLNSRGIKW